MNNNNNYTSGGIQIDRSGYVGSLETGYYNPACGNYEDFISASRDAVQNEYREMRRYRTYEYADTVMDDGTSLY